MAARTATRSPACYRVISNAGEKVTVVTARGATGRIRHCPTRRANGDARQCDGANGLKGKMPSWRMVLPAHLGLLRHNTDYSSCVDDAHGSRIFGSPLAVGCKSCVRPVGAALMTAGPDVNPLDPWPIS
jgi:hypothetical protein